MNHDRQYLPQWALNQLDQFIASLRDEVISNFEIHILPHPNYKKALRLSKAKDRPRVMLGQLLPKDGFEIASMIIDTWMDEKKLNEAFEYGYSGSGEQLLLPPSTFMDFTIKDNLVILTLPQDMNYSFYMVIEDPRSQLQWAADIYDERVLSGIHKPIKDSYTNDASLPSVIQQGLGLYSLPKKFYSHCDACSNFDLITYYQDYYKAHLCHDCYRKTVE
jgi:hypothetical protein